MPCLITTSLKNHPDDQDFARMLAEKYQFTYLPRKGFSLEELFQSVPADYFFIVKNRQLTLIDSNYQELFFHPGTGLVRTKTLDKKLGDLLITALGISPGDHVLDCTMGLANDCLVIAYYLNEGRVDALEKSLPIYLITRYGMENYREGSARLRESFTRIHIQHKDYQEHFQSLLQQGKTELYDAVYFDPMFHKPLLHSPGISPLRTYAAYDSLSPAIINTALILAKSRVVVKIRNNDSAFVKATLPDEILGGSRSRVRYAVFYKK